MRKWLVENWRAIFTCSHWTFVFCIGDRRQQLHCQLQLEWSSSRTRRVFEYNAKGHSISAETSSSRRDGAVWHKKVNSADGTGMNSNGWVKPEAEPNQGHGNCIRNPKALIYMGILFSFFSHSRVVFTSTSDVWRRKEAKRKRNHLEESLTDESIRGFIWVNLSEDSIGEITQRNRSVTLDSPADIRGRTINAKQPPERIIEDLWTE